MPDSTSCSIASLFWHKSRSISPISARYKITCIDNMALRTPKESFAGIPVVLEKTLMHRALQELTTLWEKGLVLSRPKTETRLTKRQDRIVLLRDLVSTCSVGEKGGRKRCISHRNFPSLRVTTVRASRHRHCHKSNITGQSHFEKQMGMDCRCFVTHLALGRTWQGSLFR